MQQKVAQVSGVGDVEIGGGSLPAVRIDLNTLALNNLGIPAEDVRAAIQASNATRPKGSIENDQQRLQIYTQQPGHTAAEYKALTVAWRNGAAVKLADIANVTDGPEDVRTLGLFNGQPAVIVIVTRQPGANIIETVNGVRALMPELKAQLPEDIALAGGVRQHQLHPRLAARGRGHAARFRGAGGAGCRRVPAQPGAPPWCPALPRWSRCWAPSG